MIAKLCKHIVLGIIALSNVHCIFARKMSPYLDREVYYLRVSSNLGYVHEMDYPKQNTRGVGVGVGIGYRIQKSAFLMDLGLDAHLTNSNRNIPNRTDSIAEIDEDGVSYQGLHVYTERYSSFLRFDFQIPVLFGFNINKIYALFGAKLNIAPWQYYREKGLFSHQGKYDVILDPLKDQPNHNFTENTKYSLPPLKLVGVFIGVNACFELGMQIKKKKGKKNDNFLSKRYYLSLFGEYTIFGGGPNSKNYVVMDGSSFTTRLEAGIKFTALFETRYTGPCRCRRR